MVGIFSNISNSDNTTLTSGGVSIKQNLVVNGNSGKSGNNDISEIDSTTTPPPPPTTTTTTTTKDKIKYTTGGGTTTISIGETLEITNMADSIDELQLLQECRSMTPIELVPVGLGKHKFKGVLGGMDVYEIQYNSSDNGGSDNGDSDKIYKSEYKEIRSKGICA